MPSRETEPAARWSVRQLHPAYFALVMATGIVSTASEMLAMRWVAVTLLVLNIAFYLILWGLMGLRAIRYPRDFAADLTDHGRGVGFFTWVAATCVLASQFVLVVPVPRVARVLWAFGIALWAAATYTIFTGLTVKRNKPDLAIGLNGGWLVAVVATQSVSIVSTLLAISLRPYTDIVLFFSVCMWLGGGMLYLWMISLIFYRYTFLTMEPSDLTPPYWINMGAVAISTLAGALLVLASGQAAFLQGLIPFLKGFTLFFWATATWWIPMLVILGVWRHVYRRYPLQYDPLYWGAVFPLGMYTACTYKLAEAMEIPFLFAIPQGFIYVALAAWLLTFTGLVHALLRSPPAAQPHASSDQSSEP